jgi:hypothetical protein
VSAPAERADGPRATDPDAIAALGSALAAAGYSEARLEAEFGIEGALTPDAAELPYHLHVLEGRGPLAPLVKLFQLAVAIPRAEAEEALAIAPLEQLEELGLLDLSDGSVRSRAALTPVGDLVVASDWEPEDRAPDRPDHVLGVSLPSRILACLAVQRPVENALDVGTGCGVQALLAARHAPRVVATDVSQRALRFTEFNALLNGLDRVECRLGSLFEPVEGETFDAVSCNPPYVLSPETDYVFRDSGLPGDSFCETLVRSVPEHLSEGGIAHALVSWAHRPEEDWSAPLRRWVEGSGCDAILLHHSSQGPLDYAASWNRILGLTPAAYAHALERWLDYYRGLGIERIAWGGVVLRRRADGGRVTALEASMLAFRPAGHHLERLLAAQDYLGTVGEGEDLLRERLSLPDDHRLDQTLVFRDGGGAVEQATLRLDGGLGLQVDLDASTPKLLSLLQVGVPPGEALAELAADPAHRRQLEAGALPGLRRLVELGFLVPGAASAS